MPGRRPDPLPEVALLTKAQLSRFLQVDRETVSDWTRNGCPVQDTPKGERFELQSVMRWLYKRKTTARTERSEADARKAKLEAEAKLKELEVAEREGALVPKATAIAAWRRVASSVRTALVALPGKLAPQMTDLATPAAAQAVLEREVRGVLERLAGEYADD